MKKSPAMRKPIKTPAQMREASLALNQSLRKWRADHAWATKPATKFENGRPVAN